MISLATLAVEEEAAEDEEAHIDFLYEPNKESLFEQLVPMYVQVSIVRALFESMASELGARMTAMDAATNNAGDMIDRLTLQYNRARQKFEAAVDETTRKARAAAEKKFRAKGHRGDKLRQSIDNAVELTWRQVKLNLAEEQLEWSAGNPLKF